MIDSLNNTLLAGIQNGLEKLQGNANQIAHAATASSGAMAGVGAQSLVAAVVDLTANVQQVSASIKVLKVSDELIGTLLDIKA